MEVDLQELEVVRQCLTTSSMRVGSWSSVSGSCETGLQGTRNNKILVPALSATNVKTEMALEFSRILIIVALLSAVFETAVGMKILGHFTKIGVFLY